MLISALVLPMIHSVRSGSFVPRPAMARFAKKTSHSMGPKATALRTVRKLPEVSFSSVAIRSRLV